MALHSSLSTVHRCHWFAIVIGECHSCIVFLLLLLLLSHFSHVWLCVTPYTAAHRAPPSLGFSRQEHWSGFPFPSPMHESEKWKWSPSVVSDPPRPHGLQPTKLLRPWDFPGKSTGVGCRCIYTIIYKIDNQEGPTAWQRELYTLFCTNYKRNDESTCVCLCTCIYSWITLLYTWN